jgi:hypothetical protein
MLLGIIILFALMLVLAEDAALFLLIFLLIWLGSNYG